MLLRNGFFCLLLSSLLCISVGQSHGSPEDNLQATTSVLLGTLFGTRDLPTCEGENCKSEDVKPGEWEAIDSSEYVIDYEETKPGYGENASPEVITEIVQGDEYTRFCGDLITVIKDIERLNPEFKTVKHEVLEKFGRYSREFASQMKKCYTKPAAIQLLDLIILVAEKIKSEYAHFEETPCPEEEQQIVYEPIDEQTVYEPVEEIVAEEVDETVLSPGFVGSVRGIPGEHFPNYTEVPITSFSCADVKYIPGFYADLETGCQVFHVCYEHRRESFLCPVGTIFNQPILACDYWYSSNCSLAPVYYDVNKQTEEVSKPDEMESTIGALITTIIEGDEPVVPEVPVEITKDVHYEKHDIADIVKFLPVKAEVFEFPEPIVQKPMAEDELAKSIYETAVSSATSMASKTKQVVESIPEPEIVKTVVIEPKKFTKTAYVPGKKLAKVAAIKASVPIVKAKLVADAKLAAAAIPVVKAMKVAVPVATAVKASVPLVKAAAIKPVAVKAKLAAAPIIKVAAIKSTAPVIAKAKIAAAAIPASKIVAAKASVPLLAKTKLAVAAPSLKAKVAVPVVKMVAASSFKAALPAAKVKAAAVPVMKAKIAKTATVPLVKGKMVALPLAKAKFAGATVPFVKAKAAGLPLAKLAAVKAIPAVKGKVAKAAMLSPLTKKALALGYMKLLKAKKLGMMG